MNCHCQKLHLFRPRFYFHFEPLFFYMIMISRSVAFLAFLYFLQGIPYGLQSRFLPLYFRSHGMSLSNIGYFKLLFIPWVSKAFWAPLVDHYGTKKIWLSYSMLGLFVISLIGSLISPENIAQLAIVLLLFNLLTATQDIAVDGLAIQILAKSELASGNIAQVVGYKVGALFSGGFMTWIQDLHWATLFLGLAAVYIFAFFVVKHVVPDSKGSDGNESGIEKSDLDKVMGRVDRSKHGDKEKTSTVNEHWIKQHVRMVLASSETRWTLVYVLIYKLGEQGALTMMPLYLVDQGIPSSAVGFWTGFVGQGVSIFGSFLGGWLISWYTPYRILHWFTILRPFILSSFVLVVSTWAHGITVNNSSSQVYDVCVVICFLMLLLGSGVVTTTTFTLMMHCSQRSPSAIQASHYTTMATVEVLGKLTFSILIGQFTEIFGYSVSFTLFVILAIAVIPILMRCPQELVAMSKNKS